MKKLLIIAFLTIAFGTTAAFSQKKNEPFEKTNIEAQKIIQFMTDWANLSNKHDTAALNLSPFHCSGLVQEREAIQNLA
ncbi:MAG TPA: hypothetical protein VF644_01025 [Pyrinomonadaceae bacterium]|jgi:hypothetical protein